MSSTRTEAPKYEALPVGTQVLAFPGSRDGRATLTTTRSEPWTLPAGDRVVLVEGYSGAIALTHIEVMPAPTHRPDRDQTESEAEHG